MFGFDTSSPYPAVQDWEAAGASLQDAFARFIKLSNSLENDFRATGATQGYLATRIDSALNLLWPSLKRQLAEAELVITQTRNQLRSPFYSVPEEVLSNIFTHAIFDASRPGLRDPALLKQRCLAGYRAIYNMMAVCTTWRNFLLARGSFWSVVPYFWGTDQPRLKRSFEHVIQRSKQADLNLAVADLRYLMDHRAILTPHASRFRSVEIVDVLPYTIRDIMETFADQHAPEQLRLTRVSLYKSRSVDQFPDQKRYVFHPTSGPKSYTRLFSQLSVFQIRGCLFDWTMLASAKQLTSLHLHDVMLGNDSSLADLLNSISLSQLRELVFVNIKTCSDPGEAFIPPKIRLPNLQLLVLHGLYYNTWDLVISSIQSRSHSLCFGFTESSRRVPRQGSRYEERRVEFDNVCQSLRDAPIRALLLDGGASATEWVVSPDDLTQLLEAVPSLETLWINGCKMDRKYCKALKPRRGNSYPPLISLYFSRVRLPDPASFGNVVNSYSSSLEHVGLGGASGLITDDLSWALSSKEKQMAVWLKVNVPKFTLIDRDFEPPEFRQIRWQNF